MKVLATSRACPKEASRGMGLGSALRLSGTTAERWARPYASPTVSNIAASMACAVVLPAHTTNWNAGK